MKELEKETIRILDPGRPINYSSFSSTLVTFFQDVQMGEDRFKRFYKNPLLYVSSISVEDKERMYGKKLMGEDLRFADYRGNQLTEESSPFAYPRIMRDENTLDTKLFPSLVEAGYVDGSTLYKIVVSPGDAVIAGIYTIFPSSMEVFPVENNIIKVDESSSSSFVENTTYFLTITPKYHMKIYHDGSEGENNFLRKDNEFIMGFLSVSDWHNKVIKENNEYTEKYLGLFCHLCVVFVTDIVSYNGTNWAVIHNPILFEACDENENMIWSRNGHLYPVFSSSMDNSIPVMDCGVLE